MVKSIIKYFVLLFYLSINLSAQSISALASVDSSDYLVGDYINYTLEVRAEKGIELINPFFRDSLKQVEVIKEYPPRTSEEENIKTSTFSHAISYCDSAEITIPPIAVRYKVQGSNEEKVVLSNPVSFTVHTVPIEPQAEIKDVKEPLVLSDVLAAPGATGGLFDILAACVVVFGPRGPRTRLAMLGFAAGGVVAPLRALGFADRIDAVDLSHEALPLFREVSGDWAESVRVAQDEASLWLRRRARPFDVVLEDLTVPGVHGAEKPRVSVEVLPGLVRRKLSPAGVAVTNALPVPGMTWRGLLGRLAAPHPSALVVVPYAMLNEITTYDIIFAQVLFSPDHQTLALNYFDPRGQEIPGGEVGIIWLWDIEQITEKHMLTLPFNIFLNAFIARLYPLSRQKRKGKVS